MTHDLARLSPSELLVLHASITEELRLRRITRSSNNPVGDLAESLFCRAFGWSQAPKSMREADATDDVGTRFQIKGRRLTPHNPSRQLGAIRELPKQNFDVLAGVLFDKDYRVQRAALIPHLVVSDLAKRVERTNSWRFLLREAVWSIASVRDVTVELREAERSWADRVADVGEVAV